MKKIFSLVLILASFALSSASLAANNYSSSTAAITAQNQFTGAIMLEKGGFLIISSSAISGTTINVQRIDVDGVTWRTITDNSGNAVNLTANGTYTINPQLIPGQYRAGCATGNFGSATGLSITIEGE